MVRCKAKSPCRNFAAKARGNHWSRRAQILWSKTLAKQERIAAKTKRKSMGERIDQAFIDESEQAKLFDELSPGHHYK